MFAEFLIASTAWATSPQYPEPLPPHLPIEINEARAASGLPQLTSVQGLDCAAEKHARDLAETGRCDHVGSDGSTFTQRARQCGAEAMAEIVACGHRHAAKVVEAWMADRRSRQIVLNPRNVAMGTAQVGRVYVIVFDVEY